MLVMFLRGGAAQSPRCGGMGKMVCCRYWTSEPFRTSSVWKWISWCERLTIPTAMHARDSKPQWFESEW